MAHCPKHDPKPVIVGDTEREREVILLSRWHRFMRCARCGMFGMLSNGNRRFGRGPRVIWFRTPGTSERYEAELTGFRTALGHKPAELETA